MNELKKKDSRQEETWFPHKKAFFTYLLRSLLASQLIWITGCETTFSPHSLDRYTETVKIVEIEPIGEPEIQLIPHSDGLGWTAHVMVTERVHQDVVIEEIWKGKQLRIPFSPILIELYGLLCPIGLISGMTGFFHPEQPSWIRGYEYCAGAPTHKDEITHVYDAHSITNRIRHQRRMAQNGHLQLRWQQPNGNPFIVQVPLQTGTAGTVLRIPWLADAMIRNGRLLDSTLTGIGEIIFENTAGARTTSTLDITPETLRAAQGQVLWRAPASRWPQTLQIRIETHTDTVSQSHLIPLSLVTQRLLARQIDVVAREESLDRILITQRQQLEPTYLDTAPTPGHLTPATILLQITTSALAQRWQMTATAIHIHSGHILAMMTLEDRIDQWDRLIESFSSLLPDLLAPDANRREGSLSQ